MFFPSFFIALGSFPRHWRYKSAVGNGVGQAEWGAFRVQLARRSPRAASRRPPAHLKLGAGTVVTEKDVMKPRPAGFVDNKLKQRLIQYLTSNSCGKYVDTGVLASDLQRMYSIDYGRRKRNAFRIQVEKVFSIISSEKELENLKDGHLAKRARQGQEDNEYAESYSDDDSDMGDYPDPQSANHMNTSLLSLYRKGNPDSVFSTPEMEQRESSVSTPPVTSKAGSAPLKTPAKGSEGGWFIDKTLGGKKNSFFLDASEEKNNHQKTMSEIEDSKESSLLESNKKRKGRLRGKGSKRKKEDLQEADGEIEAILQKKAKARMLEFQISNVKFEDVGGNDMTLKEVCKMLIHMRHPEVYQHLGVIPPRGVLLHGPPGCGKTLLAHAIAGELDLPILKVAATQVVSGVSGESEQKLRELFEQAVSNAPCILFIDEIDAITPKREVASKDMERRIVAQLLTCMDDLNNMAATARVLVIGATNRPDSLDPALRRAGRFDQEICLGIPDEASRERILQTLCRKLRLPEAFHFRHLAHLTPGFVGADLMALCREAAMCAVSRALMRLQGEQESDPEMGRLPCDGQAEGPGPEPTSKAQAPVRNPEQFQALGLVTPAGVLLAGPPGCGKTLLAKAVANESGLNFISVKGPELLNMYVGESERAVRQVFQRAKNSAPCVIFFDEVDALCPRRSDRETGASVRVVNQLLTEMDGLETRRQVFIMAATNRPDIIDPAILRPGRLDKTLFVGLPPPTDRHAILKTITKNGTKPPLDADVNLEAIAGDHRCDRYSGADLSALVREASVCALRQEMARQKSESEKGVLKVSQKHFEEAFKKVKSSISKKDQVMYEALKQALSQ
ncbi:nuclear valosin-containing protein-like isoform X2 [Saccopteryx bilineata]|uniref:nuclear valosin-containing protein-like isoform X2 n=1 Tax=Saccopteryx bilineata TaxID=59482 RepID=UPI00338FE37D